MNTCPCRLPSPALGLTLLVVGALLLAGRPVCARIFSTHDARWIADHAQVLVVGQVTRVDILQHIPSAPGPYPTPLQERQAEVQLLRTFPAEGVPDARPGQTVLVHYVTWDSPSGQNIETYYPAFAVGKYYGLPLRLTDGHWGFPEAEDFGMIFPAVAPALDAPRARGEDFVRVELASDFALGGFDMSYLAARWQGFEDHEVDQQAVAALLGPAVGPDEARWLEIAVGTYTALGIPRPTLAELGQGPQAGQWGPQAIISMALQHLPVPGREDRLIDTAMQHLDATAVWGIGTMLHDNYAQRPLALKLVGEALQTNPYAVYVAYWMVDGLTHPLTRPATGAAVRLIEGAIPLVAHESGLSYPDYNLEVAACALILRYGTEAEYQALGQEIKWAQTHDRARYRDLWGACEAFHGPRLIPIIRVVITDDAARGNGTFAQSAAWELQETTGVSFGIIPQNNPTPAQMEAAVARAKAWLAAHPDPPTSPPPGAQ